MPRISDYEEFLNSTMVKAKDILKLLDAGEFREPEETGFSRTIFQISVSLHDGRRKTWTMNKTTRKRLAEAYGDDTEDWVGKYVKVEIAKQLVRGEPKDVLYGRPVDPPTQPSRLE